MGKILSILIIIGIYILTWLFSIAGSQGGSLLNGISLFQFSIFTIYLIQWVAFIPAAIYETEKFFDLTGSLTYIIAILLTGFYAGWNTRTIILALLVVIWATRLGYFLFSRIHKAGEDVRFKEIKKSKMRFFITWNIQALWVSFTLGAALAAITSSSNSDFGAIGTIGIVIWVLGFSIEVIADTQKSRFRSKHENANRFIHTGFWSWSRHPNYLGEIVLWLGIALISIPALYQWQYLTLLSPIFVFLLLTRVSGIPILEQKADEKWGDDQEYQEYKKNTPVLFPFM